jgi:hypothetical protein
MVLLDENFQALEIYEAERPITSKTSDSKFAAETLQAADGHGAWAVSVGRSRYCVWSDFVANSKLRPQIFSC